MVEVEASPQADSALPWSPDDVLIEDLAEPMRARRLSDLLRFLASGAGVAVLLLLGDLRLGTAEAIQEDITDAVTNVPNLVLSALTALSGIVILAPPVLLAADLAWRRRWRLLIESLAAGVLAFSVVDAFRVWAPEGASDELLSSLTLVVVGSGRTEAAFPLFAAIVAFVSVEGLAGRAFAALVVWTSLLGSGLLALADRQATPLALAVSVLAGHAIGVAARYIVGTDNPRPPARRLAECLADVGVRPVRMRQRPQLSGLGRVFDVVTTGGDPLVVQVLDPDRRATNLIRHLLRLIRVRAFVARGTSLSQHRVVEQSALPVLAATQAEVRTPRLVAAAKLEADTGLYALEDVADLRAFPDLEPAELTDELVAEAWEQVRKLHRSGVAHEALHPGSMAVDLSGRVWLLDVTEGEIAASPLRLRLDEVELLVSSALLIGPARAVRVAQANLSAGELGRLLPLLQSVALSRQTRQALAARKDLLGDLRDELLAHVPEAPTEPLRLERVRARSVVSWVAFTIAAYVLIGQLGNVEFSQVISGIDWWWAAAALAASMLTYFGATLNMGAFAPVGVPARNLVLAQFASTFAALVAPTAVSSAGTNARLFQKAGAPGPLAVASVGVSTLVQVVTTASLFVVLGLIAGSAPEARFNAPARPLLFVGTVLVGAFALAFAIPMSRRSIVEFVRSLASRTLPRLLSVVRDPRRLAVGSIGNMFMTLGYAGALFAALEAYGESLPFATVAVVFMGANLLGSAAPTPGGIGAVEAALTAGLSAVGVPSALALPAALLYRTVTFWLPIPFGWLAFTYLQRREAL